MTSTPSLRDGRHVAQPPILLLAAGAQARLLGVGGLDVRARPDLDVAARAVDDDRVARLDQRGGVADLADRRDAERPGDDGDVARRPALLEDEAAQARAVVVEERCRSHGAGDDDGVVGKRAALGHEVAADEAVQQAVGEVVEVVQPVAQIGVGLAQHAGAVVRLHALDGGLRGQARQHRLAHAAQPALIVGEHAEGLEHLPVLAVMGDVAALDQFVDRGPHLADRLLETGQLGLDVLGDQVLHRHARLVQHDVAEADAVGEGNAALVERPAQRDAGRRRGSKGACSSPDAIISASTIEVVWSASISSSA